MTHCDNLVIGLTGGIAAGKSLVADLFAELGVDVIDTDYLARAALAPGSKTLAAVVAHFGDSVRDAEGGLDRGALRRRIFADAEARSWLERLIHPIVEAGVEAQLRRVTGPYAMLVVPLLVEKNWQTKVDRVLVIDAPEAQQKRRLIARDGLAADAAEGAMAAQTSRAARLAAAHDVIDNSDAIAATRAAVTILHRRYLELASACGEGVYKA